MNERLFVYGTLLPKLAPAAMQATVAQLRFVADGVVRGRLYDLSEYPGAIVDETATTEIVGSVFALEAATLRALDQYEGFDPLSPHASLFIRQRGNVQLNTGELIESWIYVFNQPVNNAPLIADGNYLRHVASKRGQK